MEPKNAADLKAPNAKKVHGSDGAIHHYSDDEVAGYVNLINSYLRDDDLCSKKLPINPDSDEVFGKLDDGFIFAKLINKAMPGTIDMRAMNTKGVLNVFQIKENLRLVIQSSKAIGCKIVSIFPESILEKRTHLVLGMLWQILRLCAVSHITLAHNPFLVRLLKEDEKIEDFKNLPPEEILLRWFNFHLAQAKHNRKIANFTTDLQDGVNYTVLLNQLDSSRCDLTGLNDDNTTRATKVISNATKLGVEAVIKPIDITQAHPRLNLLFTSLIFNCKHGLESQDPELKELFDSAAMLDDKGDAGDTREERAFRMWTNSLDLVDEKGEPVTMNNLYEDVKNGVMIARVMEHIAPANTVDWKKISLHPTNKFKEMENCNYIVELGKRLGFTLVNIGGRDIYDKNKKLVLAIYWQIVRQDTLATIGGMKEEDLLKWANLRVTDVSALRSFDDVSIRNCKFLFALLNSVESRAINWEHVTPGETDEEIENNAKYALSVARRIGATVFLVWEDIRDVKPKMIMTFLAAIKRVAEEGNIPRKKSGSEETVPRKISADQPSTSNTLNTVTPPKKVEEPKKSPVVEPKKSPVVEAKKNETAPKPGQGWDEGYTDPRKLFK